MTELLSKILLYFSYPFVRYAMIAGVLIALCSSLLGVTLVLRRFSFIGDGLSHVAFGAVAVATVTGITNQMIIVLPITVVSAVLLLRTGGRAKVRGDAAMAMLSVGAMAAGYLIMNVFSASANVSGDVCSTLFGSSLILTLSGSDVTLCIILSAVVTAVFLLFYNKIFAVTFDEDFARSAGVRAGAYNTLTAVITAVVIVLAMKLVGSLLISALVVFPALSAMCLFKSFKPVVIFSAALSVICAAAGIIISVIISTPVGATVAVTDMAAFGICRLISAVKGR